MAAGLRVASLPAVTAGLRVASLPAVAAGLRVASLSPKSIMLAGSLARAVANLLALSRHVVLSATGF